MTDQLYIDLADMFQKIGFGGRHCAELYTLLEGLFTPREARLALNLSPFAPEPPEKLAGRLGLDHDDVAQTLDEMADKGLIYCSLRGGDKWYKTIQFL